MSVVDNGSAAHWPPIIWSRFRGHCGKSLAAIVCWFTEALWNPMTMEFASHAGPAEAWGVACICGPENKTSNNRVSISP